MLSLVTATKKGDSSLAEVLPEWQTAEEYLIIGHHRQAGVLLLDREEAIKGDTVAYSPNL